MFYREGERRVKIEGERERGGTERQRDQRRRPREVLQEDVLHKKGYGLAFNL